MRCGVSDAAITKLFDDGLLKIRPVSRTDLASAAATQCAMCAANNGMYHTAPLPQSGGIGELEYVLLGIADYLTAERHRPVEYESKLQQLLAGGATVQRRSDWPDAWYPPAFDVSDPPRPAFVTPPPPLAVAVAAAPTSAPSSSAGFAPLLSSTASEASPPSASIGPPRALTSADAVASNADDIFKPSAKRPAPPQKSSQPTKGSAKRTK
jgi:hypothetical protein